MDNLLNKYRDSVIKELIAVYIKAALVKEFIYIFPTLSKLKLTFDHFDQYCKSIINENYALPLSIALNGKILLSDIEIATDLAIKELKVSISKIGGNSFSIKDNFISTFKQYDVEIPTPTNSTGFPIFSPGYYGKLDEEKYTYGNMYIEKYIRIKDNPSVTTGWPFNRSIVTKEVTNVNALISFLNTYSRESDATLFDTMYRMYAGVRLMYLPSVADQPGRTKSQLFNDVITAEEVLNDKTNAISGIFGDVDSANYFFPLQICKSEKIIPGRITDYKGELLQYLNNTSFNKDINELIQGLWDVPNFAKFFTYHIPVPLFEILIPRDQLQQNSLLKEVYDNHISYNKLNEILITIIDRIVNAEDPSRI